MKKREEVRSSRARTVPPMEPAFDLDEAFEELSSGVARPYFTSSDDDDETLEPGEPPNRVRDVLDEPDEDEDDEAAEAEAAVDVWPAPDPDDTEGPIREPGLSVDPEDLGRQWLGTATEQGNFESSTAVPDESGVRIVRIPLKE